MKTMLSRLLALLVICTMLMTLVPASLAETASDIASAPAANEVMEGDDPNQEPDTPGMDAVPLTLADFGMAMPDEAEIQSSYLRPQTLVMTADNEDNRHSGNPDYDVNKYLYSTNSLSPIEFRFDLDTLPVRSAYLAIYSYDCDENATYNPEYDAIYVNNTKVGVMTGENGAWNTTLISVPVEALKKGKNYVTVHIGIKFRSTGEIIEDYYNWAIKVKWAQLILDGGNAGDRPEEFNVELIEAKKSGSNINCKAAVDIVSDVSRRYDIEYSLVDRTSPDSDTYLQIIAMDTTRITGSTVSDTGTLKLSASAPSGEYIVQVLLKDASTSAILAADEKYFKFTSNVVPSFDITKLTATLDNDEYTTKDLTMTITAKANMEAGLSNIRCFVNGKNLGEMNMDSEGNLSLAMKVKENNIYDIEVFYDKDGATHSVVAYKTVDNIDREGPDFDFKATTEGTVKVTYKDAMIGVKSASYVITDSTTAPDASAYKPMPASGSAIKITNKQYMHCIGVDKLGNESYECFIPVRGLTPVLDKLTIGKSQSVTTAQFDFKPANATDKTITWTSKNSKIATVDQNGKITGMKKGETTITATSSNGKTASFKVKVVAKGKGTTKITLNKTSLTMKDSKSKTLKATVTPSKAADKSVIWRSSNTNIVTVSSNGTVKAVGLGKAYVTAYASSGHFVRCLVEVTSLNVKKITIEGKASMRVGKSQKLTAVITPAKATNPAVKWSTSDASIATIDETGRVTAVAEGNVTITCVSTDGSNVKATFDIKVKPKQVKKIVVNGLTKMKKGDSQVLTVTVTPEDAKNKDVTWSSSNEKIATVDENGVVTALKKGTVVITATAKDGSKKAGTITIKITKK